MEYKHTPYQFIDCKHDEYIHLYSSRYPYSNYSFIVVSQGDIVIFNMRVVVVDRNRI